MLNCIPIAVLGSSVPFKVTASDDRSISISIAAMPAAIVIDLEQEDDFDLLTDSELREMLVAAYEQYDAFDMLTDFQLACMLVGVYDLLRVVQPRSGRRLALRVHPRTARSRSPRRATFA